MQPTWSDDTTTREGGSGAVGHRSPIQPDLVVAELLRRAPVWATRAGDAERRRCAPTETVAELVATGAHRLLQPADFGGAESSFRDHVRAVAAAGLGCPATAWCLGVWSVHNWMISLFDPAAQRDVWAADPSVLVSASIVPRLTFAGTGQGVLVQGRFPFGSGCDHAGWFMVGGLVERDGRTERVMVLLPKDRVRIDQDTWQVSGLRGTGSKDLVVDDPVEVPHYRVLFLSDADRRVSPGQCARPVPLYCAPFMPAATLVLAPPVIGAARAALARFHERINTHGLANRTLQRNDPGARMRVAEASAEIDAAELVLLDAAGRCDALGAQADRLAVEDARITRDTAFAVRMAARAVDRLMEASGGASLSEDEPLQRLWRDASAVRLHAVLTWDTAAANYADAVLGKSDVA